MTMIPVLETPPVGQVPLGRVEPRGHRELYDRATFSALAHEDVVLAALRCRACLAAPASVLLSDGFHGTFALCRCSTCRATTVLALDPWQLIRLQTDPPANVTSAPARDTDQVCRADEGLGRESDPDPNRPTSYGFEPR